jgi:hypothetical protein
MSRTQQTRPTGFIEGAFGAGWDMNFEAFIAKTRAVATLEEATAWLDIADHTAHHRGSLAVYARLPGRVPPMLYS